MIPFSPKELAKKHRTAFALVCFCVVIAALSFYRSLSVPDRAQEVEQKTTEGRRLQTNIANAALLKDQTEALADMNKQVSRQLVNPNQLGENLQLFYRIETASATKILDVRQTYAPQPSKLVKTVLVPVPYTVSVQGEYRTLMNFIRHIEKSGRICRIISATLQPLSATDRGGGASDILKLSLNVELLGTP